MFRQLIGLFKNSGYWFFGTLASIGITMIFLLHHDNQLIMEHREIRIEIAGIREVPQVEIDGRFQDLTVENGRFVIIFYQKPYHKSLQEKIKMMAVNWFASTEEKDLKVADTLIVSFLFFIYICLRKEVKQPKREKET